MQAQVHACMPWPRQYCLPACPHLDLAVRRQPLLQRLEHLHAHTCTQRGVGRAPHDATHPTMHACTAVKLMAWRGVAAW